MSGSERTATVVGAGIGGLATALALGRAGWHVTVLERGSAVDAGGAGLVLAPNAVHALRALGVADAVLAGAAVLSATELRTAEGRRLSRVRTDEVAARCGASAIGLARIDLVTALRDALGPDVVRYGAGVSDPTALEADLLVGADGIGSVVRRTWWPDWSPRYAGYTAWRALVPGQGTATGSVATESWGRGGERFGIVPVGQGRLYVYATANAPVGGGPGEDLVELRRRFGRWHEPIPALLDRLADVTILRHDVHDLEVPDTLHRTAPHTGAAAVALVGDAAHAMEPNLGQGAGTALEDAVELAHWLAAYPVDEALGRYSAARLRRVGPMARRSRQIGRLARLSSPVLTTVRNGAFALAPERAGVRAAVAVAAWRPPTPHEEPA